MKCSLAIVPFTLGFCAGFHILSSRLHTWLPCGSRPLHCEHLVADIINQIPQATFFFLQFKNVSGSTLRNPWLDVSIESKPNANSAGKFHRRPGGRSGTRKFKEKTPSVFPAGMLMAGVTCSTMMLGLVGFLAGLVYVWCICFLIDTRNPGKLDNRGECVLLVFQCS